MKKHLFIGLIVSGVCLYYALRGLSLKDVVQAFQHADLRWIGVAAVVYAGGIMTRTFRWQGLMQSLVDVPALQLLNPMVLGFFANNVLPFRMGELVRAHVTGKKFGISRTASLGTIVLERIFDTISFLTIFLIVAMFFPFPGAVKHGALVLGGGCITAIVVLFLAATHQPRASALIARLPLSPKWKGKLDYLLANFAQGVSGMTRPSYVIRAVVLSMIVWTFEGTTLYFIAHAFPIALTYPQSFFLLFFLGLAVTLPQAPGYIGTMELFGATALSLLGIPREQGLPVILAIHGFQFLFIATLGCTALWREGVTLGSLIPESENV